VSRVCRDPPGRRMRVAQEPELLERGHLVTDRGARHAQAGALGDRLRADRLTRSNVLLDDGVQDGGLALPELAMLRHAPMIAGTLVPRVLRRSEEHTSELQSR